MLISKFDLYKAEWLDLVFSDRNRAYGAYELRQHNSRVMAQALGVMMGSILVVAFVLQVFLRHPVQPIEKVIPVTLKVYVPPKVEPVKPVEPPHTRTPQVHQAPATSAAPTIRFVPPVVTTDNLAQNLPKASDLDKKDIGPADLQGTPGAPPAIDHGGVGPAGPPIDNNIYPGVGLEREPMPVGGMEAFNKFISKHLRFPQEAEEAHVGGRVFVSFVVEKDGSLSNFTILRGPGYGTNEEALRVLKMAPAWIPGIQNSHPVRVQYNIPINFQIADDE
jgi:periplasmic protein TonB